MSRSPEVSVITPCYNAARTIGQTIESVRDQSFQNWEMLIADDCSSDTSRAILQEAAARDLRIRPLFIQENGGAACARNRAIAAAEGQYLAFLDSDDRWKPEKLAKQLDFMKKGNYAFSFTAYEYIDVNGASLGKQVDAPAAIGYHDMLKNTIVGCLTVMLDRRQIGDFHMPNLRSRQDLAAWLSLLRRGLTAYGLDQVLAEYRISGKNSLSGNKWSAASKTWHVYRRVEGLSLLKSCWYFGHYAVNAARKHF